MRLRRESTTSKTEARRQRILFGRAVVALVITGFSWGGSGSWVIAGETACVIKPYMEVSVGPPVEGIIQTVRVDRGDWITKGQILVTLEASVEEATVAWAKAKADAEATIRSTQAKVGFSMRKLERAMDLYKSNSIAKHEVDEAQTEQVLAEMAYLEAVENKRIAELEWQRANASLNLHRIHSPLTGVVVDRLLSPGELARQTPILKLAQIDPLRIEVFAPLIWLGKIKPGMKVAVHPSGNGHTLYSAQVTVVNPVVDSASGTFGVRLEMPNPNNALPAGLGCTVDFQLVE
jgi:HlyD family secretion protein